MPLEALLIAQMDTTPPGIPELAVVLPTDTYETIEPVLQKLRQQTIARRIEVILVAPSAEMLAKARAHGSDFFAIRIIEVGSIAPLGIPRAAGIRVASSPFVFVGETHSFLHTDAAEKLLARAKTGCWDAVTPGFENANPTNLFSWSAFLFSYSNWSADLPEGEIDEAPLYDTLYRREVLLEMGDRLEAMLSFGDDLRRALQARGRRLYFEPAARISHLNIAQPRPWMHEYFLIGVMIGFRLAQTWPWWRRLIYIGGVGLIPLVLARRSWHDVRLTARAHDLPVGTLPAVLLLFMIKAAGELFGYAGRGNCRDEKAVNLYEVRRIDYIA
jgi:hypothetical protein